LRVVRKHDVEAILHYVAPDGIDCVDATVPKKKVREELETPGTFAYSYLFDAAKFATAYKGYPTKSLAKVARERPRRPE
jgi:hypothetical protein